MKKQDYIYDFYNSKVYMINGNKLVKFLKEKNYLIHIKTFEIPTKNPREKWTERLFGRSKC